MTVKSYRELIVWQRGMDLVSDVYAVVRALPREERYELGSQLRRAVVSIPANIAEGAARCHTKEFLRFLSIALGSLAETETLLMVAVREGFAGQPTVNGVLERCDEVGRMLSGLRAALQRRLAKERRPRQAASDRYSPPTTSH